MPEINYETGHDSEGVKRVIFDANRDTVYLNDRVVLKDIGFWGENNVMADLFAKFNGKVGRVDRLFLPEFEGFSEPIAKVIFADRSVLMCHGNEIVYSVCEMTPAGELKGIEVDSRKNRFVIEKQEQQLGLFGEESQVANAEL